MISLTNSTLEHLSNLINHKNSCYQDNIQETNELTFLQKKRYSLNLLINLFDRNQLSSINNINKNSELKKEQLYENKINEFKYNLYLNDCNINNSENINNANNKNKIKIEPIFNSFPEKEKEKEVRCLIINNSSIINKLPNEDDETNITKIPNHSDNENDKKKKKKKNLFSVFKTNDFQQKRDNDIKVFKNKKIVYVNNFMLNSYYSSKNLKKVKNVAFIRKTERNSRYRGVSKNGNHWQVLFTNKTKKSYISSYTSEEVAARIYDILDIKKRGIKARTNFEYNISKINSIKEMKIDFKAKNINEIIHNFFK